MIYPSRNHPPPPAFYYIKPKQEMTMDATKNDAAHRANLALRDRIMKGWRDILAETPYRPQRHQVSEGAGPIVPPRRPWPGMTSPKARRPR